ncbi:PAAR domain-containing protein [Stutzerimonas nitrititolerans]|uniref:PAAR domain-containing protein n=1 Tax=Stutzerimonas nitrititolerans TaxID=2482751 RepID=UPI000718440D|nr:PAAR domain-containing protein [Stutzerimonas nitrititolerans]KRW63237.1 type IV secretion protein Rhs [Pseudomonas sp. TTU2014-066ASC]
MSGKPAARVGDPTACPKTGHGNNPITSGSPDVLFDGLPAARQGDPTGCGSALSGNLIANVLINGKPVATLDSLGDHGNVIIGGSGSIIIGNTPVPAPFSPPAVLNLQPAAERQAFAAPTSRHSPAPQQPVPNHPRALDEKAGHDAPRGLEEEEEEEELDSRQSVTLRIGMFFDGTGNNAGNSAIGAQCRASDIGLGEVEAQAVVQRCEAHHLDPDSSYGNDVSNIWRLYELYRDEPVPKDSRTPSILRVYVTGAGTTTGKKDTLFPGQALGRGDTGVLAKVDEGFSLITQALDTFQQANPGSSLGTLELDIFGFSRGAAAARHFANQVLQRASGPLGALHRHGKFTPDPDFEWDRDLIINFIGLFDTVAAIGGWEDWADPSDAMNGGIDLHLAPDAARQVVHLVARDEHRLNFALNRVSSPHREIVLPGAHSDLGGGYLPQSVERLYVARPRRSWVSRATHPLRTFAYQQAHVDTELAHQADLLDPQDRAARLETDVWEHFPAFSQSRTDAMKYVMAAPYLERTVYGHLSRVYLRVMHALATSKKVPFREVPETEDLGLPDELLPICNKLLTWGQSGKGSLDADEERLLRQRYIHLSSNWNAAVGQGGGRWDLVFVNAPAENGRERYKDMPGAKQ